MIVMVEVSLGCCMSREKGYLVVGVRGISFGRDGFLVEICKLRKKSS